MWFSSTLFTEAIAIAVSVAAVTINRPGPSTLVAARLSMRNVPSGAITRKTRPYAEHSHAAIA